MVQKVAFIARISELRPARKLRYSHVHQRMIILGVGVRRRRCVRFTFNLGMLSAVPRRVCVLSYLLTPRDLHCDLDETSR